MKAVDAKAEVAVDLAAKRVNVESARSPDEIAQAIRGAGYQAAAQ